MAHASVPMQLRETIEKGREKEIKKEREFVVLVAVAVRMHRCRNTPVDGSRADVRNFAGGDAVVDEEGGSKNEDAEADNILVAYGHDTCTEAVACVVRNVSMDAAAAAEVE